MSTGESKKMGIVTHVLSPLQCFLFALCIAVTFIRKKNVLSEKMETLGEKHFYNISLD